MALAEDETVSIFPVRSLGVDAQDFTVEYGQQIGHGQTGADMRRLRLVDHAQRVRSNAAG